MYAAFALALLTQACQENKPRNYNKSDSKDIHSNDTTSVTDTAGITFLQKAYSASLLDTKIALLIKTKSVDNGLKETGNKILLDHKRIVRQLEKTIDSIRIAVDTSMSAEQSEQLEGLNRTKGVEFDKRVLSQLLIGHKEILSILSSSEKNITTPVILQECKSLFRELSLHYEMLQKINKRIKASVDPGIITNEIEKQPLK